MEGSSGSTGQDSGPKKNSLEDLSRDELITKCKGFLALAQKAKQSRTDLLNQTESLKLQLDKCETEKKLSQENVKTLQELVDSLTEQKLNYITEIDAAQSQIRILNSKFDIYDEKIKEYKTELIVKDNQISDIEKKMSDLDTETISLKRQNKRLLEENEQLVTQLTEMESRTVEVNNIGLQQKEQLQVLEQHIQSENSYKIKIEELSGKLRKLETELQLSKSNLDNNMQTVDYESKINEITELYESEKAKKEKANIKLKSYKDKILKCAGCINQLKNSRFILAKTVKEYSENIPKWQNDIIKASKILDDKINQLNNENKELKDKIETLKNDIKQSSEGETYLNNEHVVKLTNDNQLLQNQLALKQSELESVVNNNQTITNELSDLKLKYTQLSENTLPELNSTNNNLQDELSNMSQKLTKLTTQNSELEKLCEELKTTNENLNCSLKDSNQNDEVVESLNLQIKALESEKAILVKEKLNARDNILELENDNKMLTDQSNQMKSELQTIKAQLEIVTQEKQSSEENKRREKVAEMHSLNCSLMTLQEQFDLLKQENDNLLDLNGLLKEEVETLKLSLEQPKDDTENLSDLNVSLQADIVKLETKLSAYKQENSSLLTEVKEYRVKVKEFDALVTEYDEAKSKLAGYKTENTELLNEMKEINQVLKERGEAISKLQKAIVETEKLIETLEKDRDNTKQENESLTKKIRVLENDLKNSVQNSSESIEQITIEKDNALKSLSENETLILSLKEEVERLKSQHISPDLPNEDNMSTSTLSKSEEHSRMKDLDETFEDKYTKLRIFALKLKKRLNDTTAQLQNAEQDKAKLEKILKENEASDRKPMPSTSNNDHGDTARIEDNRKVVSELEGKIETSPDETIVKLTSELENVKAELLSKSQELATEIEAHKETKENLEKARRDVKKKNVLSLEMEDYERSMKELTSKMEDCKKKMVQMESTIDTQEGTITTTKTQIKLLEEQIKAEETQNRLVKEELQHAIEESREKDNVIQIKKNIISELEQDLESEKRKNEEADIETTSLISDKEKVIMALAEEKQELNNKLKKMEFKCADLDEKLRIVNIELADLKTEYTSYKVRAQAVLRQNQTVDHSQEEQLKEETAALRAQIETLNVKVATLQQQCADQSGEAESSRRRGAEAAAEVARANQRTARLQADLRRLGNQLDSERTQHQLQVSTLTQCYKTQISDLETKHQKETEALKKQLIAAQENVKVVNVGTLKEPHQYVVPVIPKDDSDGEMDINVSMIPREEGEGSESAPSPPLSKQYQSGAGVRRSPVSLERLLEEGVSEDDALDTSSFALTPDQEISDLRRKLQAQQQRVKHVTLLLSESERDCARMGQLAELLKAELRRVRGAANNLHNTEYMKNVTLKFLTLPPGDERSRLVPVLQKILTLTADETQKIQAIAKGLDPNPNKGWGSYLPWPGGK